MAIMFNTGSLIKRLEIDWILISYLILFVKEVSRFCLLKVGVSSPYAVLSAGGFKG